MIGLLNIGSLMLGLIAWILPALGCLLFMLTKLFKKNLMTLQLKQNNIIHSCFYYNGILSGDYIIEF